MTIISSISLGVSWFDLSLLICQTMLIGLTDRKIKCRSRNTSGKQEKTGERGTKGKWRARRPLVTVKHFLGGPEGQHWTQRYFYSKQLTTFILGPAKWGSSLEYVTEIPFPWGLIVKCVLFSHSFMSDSLRPHGLYNTQDSPVLHNLPELAQTYVHRVGDAIQPSHPLSHPSPTSSQSFPASGSVPMCQLFASVSQSTGASAAASVLPVNFLQDWLVWSPCSPRDSQKSSLT